VPSEELGRAHELAPQPARGGLTGEDLRRLRWRARRGLLENDLLVARFLDRHGERLTAQAGRALSRLLDLSEAELLDLLLCRRALPPELDEPAEREVLAMMQSV